MSTTPSAASVAESALANLAEQLGAEMVISVIETVIGDSGLTLIEDVSMLAGAIARAAIEVLGPAAAKAAVTMTYAAANAAGEAALAAKFGTGSK